LSVWSIVGVLKKRKEEGRATVDAGQYREK
jgi:hypothetical protein